MAVLFVFYSSQTKRTSRCPNVDSPPDSYTHTRRRFSCCLTASTYCLDIPIKRTTGASSTSLKKIHGDGRRLLKTSSLLFHKLYDVCRLKYPVNHGGQKCVWNVYQYWEESEYELLKPNREIFDAIKKLLDRWPHWTKWQGDYVGK